MKTVLRRVLVPVVAVLAGLQLRRLLSKGQPRFARVGGECGGC
jgi:hypothetical protein